MYYNLHKKLTRVKSLSTKTRHNPSFFKLCAMYYLLTRFLATLKNIFKDRYQTEFKQKDTSSGQYTRANDLAVWRFL